MTAITITEALAEIKTIGKRLEKMRQFVIDYIGRQDAVRDPLERDGGSVEAIKRKQQAIRDLEARVITLRRGISRANDSTVLTVGDVAMSVSDWLTWRREIAAGRQQFCAKQRNALQQIRTMASRNNSAVVQAVSSSGEQKPTDYIINISEKELADETERLEDILGQLDGKLSLVNATVPIVID